MRLTIVHVELSNGKLLLYLISGMLGVRDIEMAIKTRFDIGKYKICWIVGPVCDKRPHGLFQADIWIAEKKMPDHTQMIKLWNYMKMLNEEGSEGKI